MDASEKIIRFNSYESLMQEILRDMEDTDPLRCRYPVRYILFNNFNIFTNFAQDLAHLGVNFLNIEDLLSKDDGWITTDQLSKSIRSLKDNTLVTPFSELVRFYDQKDFRGFFNEIMLIEDIDHPTKRIYIPLIGLQNRFENFLNGFARIEESEPVWCYADEEQKTDVFLTKYKNESSAFSHKTNVCCLNTMREWLRFWKIQAPQTQIICSSGPIFRRCKNSDPDNIFTFRYINNDHEYIESFLGINIPFTYTDGESKYWEQLLTNIIKTGPALFNFSSFVLTHFNARTLNPDDIMRHWIETEYTDYERWLMKNYFLCSDQADKYPYFKTCLEECEDYSSFFELITKYAERIFYFSEDSTKIKHSSERNDLMNSQASIFNEYVSQNTKAYIKDSLAEINQIDPSLAMLLCTGVFDFEKVLCMAWYVNKSSNGFTLEHLEIKYPELAQYLSPRRPSVGNADNWHLDYLTKYRNAKLADVYTEEVKDVISTVNHDSDSFYKWYYSFEESHNRLEQHLTSDEFAPDKIYWIDALGAEFLPYILSIFDDDYSNYKVIYSEITRCTIPSATSQNRYQETIKIADLDELAHDKAGYKKYETLVNELKVIQSKLREISLINYTGEHTIAIVSDHGLSSLSRLCDSKKYDAKIEHDGRYIKVPKEGTLYHDSDYIVHVNENDEERYKVALTPSSLGRKPIHEVHGGCTPEEVLVPYIIISNKKIEGTKYSYSLITKEIEISDPLVTVNIMPLPASAILCVEGKEYKMTRNGSKWSAKITDIDEGEHAISIKVPGGTPYNDKLRVNGTGFSENDFLKLLNFNCQCNTGESQS